jgi:hypothetical protein
MHFGLYLRRKGTISADQLVCALESQVNNLVPIGQLALEEGLLSARDIFRVLQAQSGSPAERFGDLAVEMGLMTRDQVMRLLMVQADRRPKIADILVEQGVLNREQLASELSGYRQSMLNPKRTTTTRFVPKMRSKLRDEASSPSAV